MAVPTFQTQAQFQAMRSGANANTLANRLMSFQDPNKVAAASSVKNVNAPQAKVQYDPNLANNPSALAETNTAITEAKAAPKKSVVSPPSIPTSQPLASTPPPPLVNPNSAIQTNTGNAPQGTPPPATPTLGGITSAAVNSATGNAAIGQSAADIAARYGQEYADVGRKGANAESGYLTTGTSPVAEGNAAVQVQNTAAQQQAIAEGETAALQGTSQQLTAQNQQTTGLVSAGGLATPATKFSQVSPGNIAIDENGKPVASAPQLGAIGTQTYYDPSNPSATSGGTPFTGGQVQGDVSLGQQYAQNVSANNQAKAVKGQIVNYLAQNPNLNPSVFTDINSITQLLNGKTSNPQYQILANDLQEYVNTLAPILGVGGDTTNLKTEIANAMVNAQANGQSISQVLDGIEKLADAKLAAQQGGSNSTGQTSPSGTTNPTSGNIIQTPYGNITPDL